ncbi:hypothetical protein [Chitinophaga sp. 212800010-3]|uniref:hypothetical protein n=1 Tax=unclassified Chitinophaga TaxID=2619133 RepID=UPI002DF1503C|nr:DUF4367 domain-containing protein [Chitinophaga sp. 212800010-3]
MFIVYQIRSIEHVTQHFPDLACPLGKQGGVTIVVMQRYVAWIGPMMPSAKYGIAFCDDGEKIPSSKWTPEIRQQYKALKAGTRTPLRLWRGMIVLLSIIAVGIIWGVIATHFRKKNEQVSAEYLAHPQAGDIFYASTGGTLVIDGNSAQQSGQVFALFKVQKVDGDSIFLLQGNARRVSTPDHYINEYESGFWNKLEDETSSYSTVPIIVSHHSILQYNNFLTLPRNPKESPGRVSKVLRHN